MRFEWDARKNRENVRKHGLDFTDAWEVFENPLLVQLDTRDDSGENRWIGVGMLQKRGILVVIVFTEPAPDVIRIISLRKATKNEKERYEKAIQDGLEAS